MSSTKIPAPFPKDDKTWIDVFRLEKKGCDYYPYKNDKGEILFIVYVDRSLKERKGEKSVFQGSYDGERYVFENLWNKIEGWKTPLYRLDELLVTDKPIKIAEGEKCAVIGQKLFPEYFWTCWQGGRSNWKKVDWSPILNKDDLTLVADIDSNGKGKEEFTDLARWLNKKYDSVNVKQIELPTFAEIMNWHKTKTEEDYKKKSWDVADEWYPQYTYEDFREGCLRAVVPEPLGEYEDINSDIESSKEIKKLIFISKSSRLYFDIEKQSYFKDTELNQLYKRDPKLKGLATTKLHKNNIPYVDQQTFRPGADQIIEEGNLRLLNKYKKPEFAIKADEVKDISIFLNHLKLLANEDEKIFQALKDIIAFDLQFPQRNRTFAVIFYSGQGTGKNMFFSILKRLYGASNCSFLRLDQLLDKFQPFMLSSNYLFISEIDSTGKDIKSKQAKLRELISDTDFMVEMKGVDLIPVTNCHYTIWGSTNEPYPLSLPGDDRRTMFIDIGVTKYEILQKDKDYFKKLVTFRKDPLNIASVYHYFKNVHVISKEFDPNEPPVTTAKDELIEASKPQYMKTLDDLFEGEKIVSFKRDIVNAKLITQELKALEDFSIMRENFTENKVLRWIRFNPKNFRILKGEPYQIPGSLRGRCWVIRNHPFWNQHKTSKEMIDLHFEKKVETPLFKQKDIYDEQKDQIPF
jgi:hypothetical protein